MAATKYTYSVSQDFPNQKVNPDLLTEQIQDSAIVTALDYINVTGDDCDIWFKDALSAGDKTILDTLVANHSGAPTPAQTEKVDVENFATIEDPTKVVQRVVVQPGRTGYFMCDRDIKINTGVVGADSFQDLKVNSSDNKQESWGEVSLVGCYKLDSGNYVACADQADADTNAVLSVYDYVAINQTTDAAIEYDFKGGALWSDASLVADVWEHRMYAMLAPNIPAASGGSVRFFDGYLYPYQGKWQECVNSLSLKIDPSQSVEAARIRFWIYYPAGAKQNHVLRIITYRKPETN
jgi:hypothetical protein